MHALQIVEIALELFHGGDALAPLAFTADISLQQVHSAGWTEPDLAVRWRESRIDARGDGSTRQLPSITDSGSSSMTSRRRSIRSGGLCSSIANGDQVLSEIRVRTLIRPIMKRRLLPRAGHIVGPDAACRWRTPDPATPFRAVAGSGVDALPVGWIAG
jgi:hypothetical protein